MRPEVRPRKLTRRSASPSGKVFKMMASVSRAGISLSARRRCVEPYREHCPNRTHTQNQFNYHTRSPRANLSTKFSRSEEASDQRDAERECKSVTVRGELKHPFHFAPP